MAPLKQHTLTPSPQQEVWQSGSAPFIKQHQLASLSLPLCVLVVHADGIVFVCVSPCH